MVFDGFRVELLMTANCLTTKFILCSSEMQWRRLELLLNIFRMSTLRFQDKVAIVTGGCQGVGRGCVDVLVENGGKVIVFDIADEIGLQMTSEGPGQIKYKHCDVTKEDEIRKSIDESVQEFGKLDCLVNNVGYHQGFHTIDELSVESFREVLEINLISNFTMSKFALPYLRKSKGCIVNISSIAASAAVKNSSTYCATKGGVKSLTKALAIDEAKNGVRVNSLAPSAVDTLLLRERAPEETWKYLASLNTFGRIAKPREIGLACLFLAVYATFTTGEELMCTGGSEIGYGVKDPNSLY